ncbi:MAG: hypothetical protein HQ553_09115 [Chloroflexi bacterium]|nr:hypothetical protein [Chloroflexota bacterium]
MKKMLPFFVVIALLIMAGCGGSDSTTDEVTESPEATEATPVEIVPPPPEPVATAEATPTPEPVPTPEASPTPPPEPSPTTEPAGGSVEEALASVMSDLVLAFGNVDGEWQGYAGSDVLPLTTLENGSVYYWYATEDISLGTIILYTGWNLKIWMSDTGPTNAVMAGYENSIPFVITTDDQTMQSYLYQSAAVAPLTEIITGQTYNTFTVGADNPVPNMSTLP